MSVSLGFLIITFFVLFPGLLFRRLFFYGEFSKEFNSGHNLPSLLGVSSIPGLIIFTLSFGMFSFYFSTIDFVTIIDYFKKLNNPSYNFTNSEKEFIKTELKDNLFKFLFFIYIISFILGAFLGRVIRITKLDTRFKLLRFKNYWFYLFNGQHSDFKKFRHFKERNKKHVFTKADILIDTNEKPYLYSGIIIDYELKSDNMCELSKVILQNAERYSYVNKKRERTIIPGQLFVVDCTYLKNINLTYVYEDAESIVKSKIPPNIELFFAILYLILIPICIFKIEDLEVENYKNYFLLPWYSRFIIYLLLIQIISLFNPFVNIKGTYRFINLSDLFLKLGIIISYFLILYFI